MKERYLYLVMDYYETSLQIMLKEHRKLKTKMQKEARKVLAFQLFKALYYMQVSPLLHRTTLFATEISSPPTSA